MIRFAIGTFLLLGFMYNMLAIGPSAFNSYNLVGQGVGVLIGLLLMYFGYRKAWPKFKKEEKTKLTFGGLIKEFVFNYKSFLKSHLDKRAFLFLLVTIWLLGINNSFDRFEVGSLVPDNIYLLADWALLWLAVILIGLPFGFAMYIIGGAFFHLLVWISGGDKGMKLSRRIFAYSALPTSLTIIVSKIFYTIAYGNSYFTEPVFLGYIYFWLIIAFLGVLYTIYLSYTGARLVQHTKKVRSIIFFLVLPLSLTVLVFVGLGIKAADPSNFSPVGQAATAITEDSDSFEIHFRISSQYLSKSDITPDEISKALFHSKKAYEMQKNTRTTENYALSLFLSEQHSSARPMFEELIEENPSHAEAMLYLAVVEYHYGDYERTMLLIEKAIEINPTLFNDSIQEIYNSALELVAEEKMDAH